MIRRSSTALRIALLPVSVCILTCGGCNETAPPPVPLRPVLAIDVAPVTRQAFGPFASTVEPRYQAQLGFQVAGRMVARDVEVGDNVRKGQRLAALDPTVLQFALLRAKADVADAQAQLANAQGIEDRQRILATGGNASQAVLDNAVAGRETAKARLDQAKASLRMAEDKMGYTELHANFDAVVTAWNAVVGQYVDTGQATVTLARPDIREAVVDIPDELIGSITVGMPFLVRLQAAPAVTAVASVREIGPLADDLTRSHRVRLTLRDPSPAFRLGTTVTIAHETEVTPFIPVPAGAVLSDGGKSFVWVLTADGKRVERRDVEVEGTCGESCRTRSGLVAGDKVVVVGVHSLRDGQAVAGRLGADVVATKAGASRL